MLTAIVIGNLGKDAETKTIGERQYIAFRMASTAKRKDGDKTTWVSVMYRYNDRLLPYLKKGQQVFVQGDIHQQGGGAAGRRVAIRKPARALRTAGNGTAAVGTTAHTAARATATGV